MKTILIILFIFTSLYSKSKESCYTVQLISKYNSKKNIDLLNTKTFPQSCKIMSIGNSLTVRCGCFSNYAEAKEELHSYKDKYKLSVVSTTYKYRFDDSIVAKSVLRKSHKKKATRTKKRYKGDAAVNSKDEELRLVLQVFLYKGDVKNAYKVASLGYKKHPNSYYWNQKMAEISQWTNRSARSMKHLRNMYDIRHDSEIEKKLIDYGSSAYQYEEIEPLVINRAVSNPTEENIDLMILVFKKIGAPEKVVAILEKQYLADKSNRVLLTKALALSLEMGDLELSKKYVHMTEATQPYSKKDAALIARYYYVKHDMEKSYRSLDNVKKEEEQDKVSDHIKYYELKSDLGWYLQDNKEAALASKHLMEHNRSRLVDYERISFVYQKTDPKLAMYATKRAYEEYKLSYLFYGYANGALNSKNFDELRDLIYSVDETKSPLAKEALYWMIKSKVYAHYNKYALEQEALNIAYEIEPDNYQIKLELLWFYMDIKDTAKLKIILIDLAESPELDTSSYLPMASAYFSLSDINRASYYTNELLLEEDPVTNLIEFKFLQAYIYQVQNNEYAFSSYMQDIVRQLKEEAKENPRLKTEDVYLSNYLRAAMNTLNPDKFEKKLKKAKPYLKKANYDEIAYSWAIKNSADEKSRKIYHKMNKPELWAHFSDAILSQDHSRVENLLEFYLESLSVGDASQASQKDGQIALSQTITFDILNTNQKNQNAYVHHVELSKERSDKLNTKLSYYHREPLLQKYIKVNNSTYLQDGYYLDAKINYFLNSSSNEAVLINVPTKSMTAGFGLKRLYNRGYVKGSLYYHNSMKEYLEVALDGEYQVSTDIKIGTESGFNMNAQESTQLLLGGKKDMLSVYLAWQVLNSTAVHFSTQYNKYSSQDEVDLGDGIFSRVSIVQQIRNGYPDLRLGAFYDRGLYDENYGEKGVISDLTKEKFNVLPNDFYNIGMTLSYGMANSNIYTRVWRPYVEVYPYYNSDIDAYTFGALAGYGGKVFHQDHLSIGASYTDSVNGIGGSILEIYLNYQFMYYHP